MSIDSQVEYLETVGLNKKEKKDRSVKTSYAENLPYTELVREIVELSVGVVEMTDQIREAVLYDAKGLGEIDSEWVRSVTRARKIYRIKLGLCKHEKNVRDTAKNEKKFFRRSSAN